MTTNTGWCMETEVIITDSSGEVTIWYPFIDEDNRIAALCDDNGNSLYYDFSPYDRLNYENLIGIYYARKGHKLPEWHTLCDWIRTLPYAQDLILVKEADEG